MARPGNRATARWGKGQDVKRMMEEKEGGGAAREVFVDVSSGGRPVRAPCPMRGSRFQHAGLPSGRLLNLIIIYKY
jgi:hypothetical protein